MSKKFNSLMAMMTVSLAMAGMTNNDKFSEVYDDGMPKLSDKEKKKRQKKRKDCPVIHSF